MLASTDEPTELLGRAAYWRARTLADAGRSADAATAYDALARRYPLSFYAQQGLSRLRALEPARADAILEAMRRTVPLEVHSPEGDALWAFERAAALLSVGEVASAELELEASRALDPSSEPERLLLAATLLEAAGESGRAMRLVRGRDSLYRASMPVGAAHALWRIAYPEAFAPLIEEAAAREAIPSSFVRAVAREESAFNPSAISHAHAYGLVQLILPTARDHARSLGLEATPTSLRDPETNLRIGTRFMARLFRRYETCPALVPAAYNAGPGAVDRWLRDRESKAFDELVEDIPYDETRRYARRVLASYGVYSFLESGSLPALAERIP
ncbi:MAG: lytic transglycosylase domain-containing protein [Polyangiaceae bacterium]|nr:lytic transglycosylase domain-containing protein [Polyangiaceae bacterium]